MLKRPVQPQTIYVPIWMRMLDANLEAARMRGVDLSKIPIPGFEAKRVGTPYTLNEIKEFNKKHLWTGKILDKYYKGYKTYFKEISDVDFRSLFDYRYLKLTHDFITINISLTLKPYSDNVSDTVEVDIYDGLNDHYSEDDFSPIEFEIKQTQQSDLLLYLMSNGYYNHMSYGYYTLGPDVWLCVVLDSTYTILICVRYVYETSTPHSIHMFRFINAFKYDNRLGDDRHLYYSYVIDSETEINLMVETLKDPSLLNSVVLANTVRKGPPKRKPYVDRLWA